MKHSDTVFINPILNVYTDIDNLQYHEVWSPARFNEDVVLKNNIQVQPVYDAMTGRLVRKLSDGRYVVSILVTHITGKFSDSYYTIVEEQDIRVVE